VNYTVTIRITAPGVEKISTSLIEDAESVEKAIERAVMGLFLSVCVDDDDPGDGPKPNVVTRTVILPRSED
jgi:hypothetical protein